MTSSRTARSIIAALFTVFSLTLLLTFGGPAAAQIVESAPPPVSQQLETLDAKAAFAEKMLESEQIEAKAMEDLRQTMSDQRAIARALVEQLRGELEPLQAQEQALGPPPAEGETEAPDVALSRAELKKRFEAVEGRFKRAELAEARADSLLSTMAKRQRAAFSNELFSRGPTAIDLATWTGALAQTPGLAQAFVAGAWEAAVRLGWALSVVLAFAVAGLAFALYFKPRSIIGQAVDYLVARIEETRAPSVTILLGVGLFLVRVAPLAAIMFFVAETMKSAGALSLAGRVLADRLVEGVLIVLVASAAARIFFAPRLPSQRVIALDDQAATWAWARVTTLAALICGGRAVLDTATAVGGGGEFLTVVNLSVALASAPIIHALTRTLCAPAQTGQRDSELTLDQTSTDDVDQDGPEGGPLAALAGLARMIGLALAIAIPTAAVLGYYALSRFMLERAAMTVALLMALGLAFVIVKRILRGPVALEVDAEGQISSEAKKRPGLGLAPAITVLLLAMVAAPLLAAIWGASATDLRVIAVDLLDGVEIGDSNYSLVDLFAALAVLVAGVWVTRLVQRLFRVNVLPNTTLDRGVQSSLTTGLGYIGFSLTALLAVSAAGLDLSNLALVAGALSIGIGFGLQNVVNNFVSGLILLIERPIKIGDWIVVGGYQGYVRRINVRSTEIETFDRSSVIVPNSELISGTVTNWTHKNSVGRVITAVGVSYDADSEKVAQILREIATAHPLALRYPAPFVYFAGFGDSALDFELRVMIRDVNSMLSVRSELNHAIHKRFREEGIEIPFPQRDLNIRSGLDSALQALAQPSPPKSSRRPHSGSQPHIRVQSGERDIEVVEAVDGGEGDGR
ncbi:MAG: DUF3772 domain-containing protein [Rhodobacteraceae bacterium]|nr:DUF3772 domain-containing protein [Paracoccaceae bacterium]